MATNRIYVDGRMMPYANATGAAIASGQPVLVGAVLGVAQGEIPVGETGELDTQGVYELPKAATIVASQGAKAYFVASSGEMSTVASGNTLVGTFFVAAAAEDTSCLVKLNFNA